MEIASEYAPALEARGFSFSYEGVDIGIGPVDWCVERGAFCLLVGYTGSGKTTLLRQAKPAIAPVGVRRGELRVFGCAVDKLDAMDSAQLVGYVSQSPDNQIVCDTVWHELAFGLENLGTPNDVMRRRVAEVAHFFGIEPWFRRSIDELSGGQRQIVTLASILAMQPHLLLLDEPTSQLDPVAEKNFLHALYRVNRELGITVVVATHAPEAMATYATAAFALEEGRVVPVDLDTFAPRRLALDADKAAPQTGSAACEQTVLEVSDAYVRYSREGDWIICGADLTVERGDIHALIGGNGCGKSTMLRLLAGVMKPERGRVHNGLSNRQALLPQDPKALFVCDTVEEELREWQANCGYADSEVTAMLQRIGLVDRTHNHPFDLSGGQQQVLALAKLLLTDPDLLLLDEPTKGLDPSSKLQVADMLARRARQGATIVMATHDLAFAALVARTASMLFDGEVTCTQPVGEFFAYNLFYRPVEDGFARLFLEQRNAHAC